jgi:hypothetical protein
LEIDKNDEGSGGGSMVARRTLAFIDAGIGEK